MAFAVASIIIAVLYGERQLRNPTSFVAKQTETFDSLIFQVSRIKNDLDYIAKQNDSFKQILIRKDSHKAKNKPILKNP
jgi:hypothetical protein